MDELYGAWGWHVRLMFSFGVPNDTMLVVPEVHLQSEGKMSTEGACGFQDQKRTSALILEMRTIEPPPFDIIYFAASRDV